MQIYAVVPALTNVSGLVAKPGWRVFLTLTAALGDIENRFSEATRRIFAMSSVSAPVPIVAEIPGEHLYENCMCGPGVSCAHHPYLLVDAVNIEEPVLKQRVTRWRRVSRFEVDAFELEEKILGRPADRWEKRWKHKDKWFENLPYSEETVRPVMMTTGQRKGRRQ